MTVGERIKYYREQNGITQSALAEHLDTTKQNIYKYENGIITNIPSNKIEHMAKIFGITPAELMGWETENIVNIFNNSDIMPIPKTKSVPLVGTIACGSPVTAVENVEDYVAVDEDISADFALKCKGDSMIEARICDGDVVYIHIQPTVENGEIAAVLIDDEATLKKVYISGDTLTLIPCNSKYRPFVYTGGELNKVHILGKAVGFSSKI